MPITLSPHPLVISTDDLRSGDLIARGDQGLAIILMIATETISKRRTPCSLNLSTFELVGFEDYRACVIARDYIIEPDAGQCTPQGANNPSGGELAISSDFDGPLFMTNSGKGFGFTLTGDRHSVSTSTTAFFPRWSIAIGDSLGGRRELFRR